MALLEAKLDTTEVEDLLKDFASSALKLAPTMEIVAEMFVAAVDDRYESEGDGEWQALSAAYVKRTGPHSILQLSGIMAGTTFADSSDKHAAAATGTSYIVYHLDGGEIMPKRNPFEISDEVFEEAEQFIVDEIAAKLGK